MLIGTLIVVAAVLLGSILYLQVSTTIKTNDLAQENQDFISCVSDWANKTSIRTSILTGLNIRRQDALDTVIRDVALGQNPKADRAALTKKFQNDIEAYVKVSDTYNDALKNHPPPKSPKFSCPNDK